MPLEEKLPPQQTMLPNTAIPKGADPFYVAGADDRPLDNRVVAICVTARAEVKVGDREFSAPANLHEIVVLRAFYEARAGTGLLRATTGWPTGLTREKSLTHSDLQAEVDRMRRTFVVVRPGGQVLKIFESFFGTEPTEQLKRLHAVMREQYEAWKLLVAKASTRLPADTATMSAPQRLSAAYDLITERELDEIILLADPARRNGRDTIELPQVAARPDVAVAPTAAPVAPLTLEGLKAAGEAAVEKEKAKDPAAIDDDREDALVMELNKAGLDTVRSMAVGSAFRQAKGVVSDEELIRILGSKNKLEQVKSLLLTA